MTKRTGIALATAIAAILLSGLASEDARADCFNKPYSCLPPGDIDPATSRDYVSLYRAYAALVWQDFLALNFPAATDGQGNPLPQPSSSQGLDTGTGSYIPVWQTYIEARELFLPNGAAPAPFASGHPLPQSCRNLNRSGVRLLLNRVSKAGDVHGLTPPAGRDIQSMLTHGKRVNSDTELAQKLTAAQNNDGVLDEYVQALRMGPVIDQNGNYLRFGLNFNKAMYDYIVSNQLYNVEGQQAFDTNPNHNGNPVQFPAGVFGGDPGSIFVKSSWKILSGPDNAARFFRVPAYIYDEAGGPFGDDPTVEERCSIATVGLVGFHVVHLTNSAPQWVWATFEHLDNAPWLADFRVGTPSGSYSLFNPALCPAQGGAPSCTYNTIPAHPWNPQIPNQTPVQVVRVAPPGLYAEVTNANAAQAITNAYGSTVWQNYFLVDVQFPTIVDVVNPATGQAVPNPAYPDGVPTPSFLANSTLETYIQGFGPAAATTNGNVIPSDDQMQAANSGAARVNPFSTVVYNQSGGAPRETSGCVSCHFDATLTTGSSSHFVFSLSRAQSMQPLSPAEGQ